ncbi:MAG: hypothetical protein ACRDPT_15030, partial [Streptomycetales bacterium]
PMVNGEGAIVHAPGGDVLGVEWDPYTGDHLQAFKFESDTGQWLYQELPLHQPFFDREWIAVVPGPVTIDGQTHEYVSFIKGGFPSKEAWLYSTDGLNYTNVMSKFAEHMLSGATTSSHLSTAADPAFDWSQANTNGRITQLGNGDALAGPDQGDDWYLFDGETFSWSAFTYPDGSTPQGVMQLDSAGRIHEVVPSSGGASFTYRLSGDGGRTWQETPVALPAGHVIEELDFRANRAAGVSAVGIHAHDATDNADQDLVYKLDITGDAAQLRRQHFLGLGDVDGSSGVGADVRFDFETIAIFPDGRVAVSFYDTTTTSGGDVQPALAVELDTKLGGRVEPVEPQPPPSLGTPVASFTFDGDPEGWTTGGVPTWARSEPGTKTGADEPGTQAFAIEQLSYVDAMDATVTSPPIATPAGLSVVQFWLKLDTEEGFDFVQVEWSADGATWQPLGSFSGQNAGHPAWQQKTLGFDSPGGDVQVRFRFTSDVFCAGVSCGHQGARVDEVVVGTAR